MRTELLLKPITYIIDNYKVRMSPNRIAFRYVGLDDQYANTLIGVRSSTLTKLTPFQI